MSKLAHSNEETMEQIETMNLKAEGYTDADILQLRGVNNSDYLKELRDLQIKMVKAEAFAKRIPCLSEAILEGKYTGEEAWLKIADRYKKLYCAWGINRGWYDSEEKYARTIINFPKDKPYSTYLFNIYINTCNLFDAHQEFGLYEALKDVDIFFADKLNTTFYVTDENIESFLEALNTWVIAAYEELKTLRLNEQKIKLEAELAKTTAALSLAREV